MNETRQKKTRPKKRAENLSETEKFALDAYFVNKNVDMAYRVGRGKTEEDARLPSFHRMAVRWVNLPHCVEYLKERTNIASATEETNSEQTKATAENLRTKDGIINALVAELKYTRGKARADLLMKLADLQRLKEEESETDKEDTTVHYYLPGQCYMCNLYLQEKERRERNGTT